MSQQHITEKLPSRVRDLVVNLMQDGRQHMGRNDNDEGEVAQWIEKIAEGSLVKGDLQVLDPIISSRYEWLDITRHWVRISMHNLSLVPSS